MGKKNLSTIKVVCKDTYTVGGTITGLTGNITLVSQSGKLLSRSVNGLFKFAERVAQGKKYSVKVKTKPASQLCTVSRGSGIMGSANVNNVAVNCSTQQFAITGTVSGLTADGLELLNNDVDGVMLMNGARSFSFTVAYGAGYNISISKQPPGLTCSVSNGSGTNVTNVVTNVAVTCNNNTAAYTISGEVMGYHTSGLVLQNMSNGEPLPLQPNDPHFLFEQTVPAGGSYDVQIATQPVGQTCSVSQGRGGNVQSNVQVFVDCMDNPYPISVIINGLVSGGQGMLNLNGNDFPFTDNGQINIGNLPYGVSYTVSVKTQPTGQTCTVDNGVGTVLGDVPYIFVNCTNNAYKINATVTGLTAGTPLGLTNYTTNTTTNISGDGTYTLDTVAPGGPYDVQVSAQPSGQTCTVDNGSGANVQADVNLNVTCADNLYTIGGTVTGVSGPGLSVLLDNGETLSVLGSSYQFTTKRPYNSVFSVTILTSPAGQSCVFTGPNAGTVTGDVFDVNINCTSTDYTLSGTVTGLSGGTLRLRRVVNGTYDTTNTLTVSANGTFTLPGTITEGGYYGIYVYGQPTGQSCYISNATGKVNGNVTNISVSCVNVNPVVYPPCGVNNVGKNISGVCWVRATEAVNAPSSYGIFDCYSACQARGFYDLGSPAPSSGLASSVCGAFGVTGANNPVVAEMRITFIATGKNSGNSTCYWADYTSYDWYNQHGLPADLDYNQEDGTGSYFCPCIN